jgi:8-oxo-dGTP pyrophosphatase MutT (NUDIX family)
VTVWRPPQSIRVKVLGLAWRGDELLLAEVEDDSGRVTGLRAPGGGIEFGETREEALQREFREEFGCGIAIVSPWLAFENLFAHEGLVGHEYLFVASIRLADERFYAVESVPFVEPDLTECRAGWFSPAALPSGVELYPAGLLNLIASGEIDSP